MLSVPFILSIRVEFLPKIALFLGCLLLTALGLIIFFKNKGNDHGRRRKHVQ